MNELKKEDLKKIKMMLRGSHHTNLIIRTGGKDWHFQADFLKKIIMGLPE